MDAWQPPPVPKGQDYVDILSRYRTRQVYERPYFELLNDSASTFSHLTRSSRAFDEPAQWIETWIRKRLRTWSGGDISEFTVINEEIKTGYFRIDDYFQGVNRIICGDESVRLYLQNLYQLDPLEQIIWINVLLHNHPQIKKLYYARCASLETGVLMYHIGLDKFGKC